MAQGVGPDRPVDLGEIGLSVEMPPLRSRIPASIRKARQGAGYRRAKQTRPATPAPKADIVGRQATRLVSYA